ncbi:MAG: glutathione S-transferase family protein [Thermodesulfobacteriota bacterium]
MIKLYDHPLSGNAYKPRLLLHQLGVPFERIIVDLFKGEHKNEEFSKLNQNQKIPVIVDGNFVMWESNAILLYLVKKYSPNSFSSDDPETYGHIAQWVLFGKTTIDPNLAMARYLAKFVPDHDPKDMKKFHAMGNVALKTLDDHLTGKDFLVGNYSIADIACYPYIMLAPEGGVDLTYYLNIQRWMENIGSTKNFLPFGD